MLLELHTKEHTREYLLYEHELTRAVASGVCSLVQGMMQFAMPWLLYAQVVTEPDGLALYQRTDV